ncbi:MAG: hypothetical protein FH759_12875 [Sediminimonas qiaohouensis]|uniref:DUF2946 domain-containing protein n=2 Tax=Sediminimonas qiaohouensis TaxID=552061 RepID=A0A7C9L9G7_9RHOB|nr:hypothetical protein [Sediminimonas qiaohouensis]
MRHPMPINAKFLSPLLVALALLLAAGLLGGQAHAHGPVAPAAQPALPPADQPGQAQTGHAAPHCNVGAICAPAIEAQAATTLAGPDRRATLLRSDHAAPYAVSHTPVADPPPPRA